MGFYINPTNGMTKEEFLHTKGLQIRSDEAETVLASGTHLPVCLVDNGPFTAAGILYSLQEINDFARPNDSRPKMWFSVPVEDLKEFYPGA